MDDFFGWVFCILMALCLATCTGCSILGSRDLSDKELIEAVAEAGCNLKTVKREDGEIERIDCLDTVRVLHER